MYNQSTRKREDNNGEQGKINIWNGNNCIFSLTNEIRKPTDTGHKPYTKQHILKIYMQTHYSEFTRQRRPKMTLKGVKKKKKKVKSCAM